MYNELVMPSTSVTPHSLLSLVKKCYLQYTSYVHYTVYTQLTCYGQHTYSFKPHDCRNNQTQDNIGARINILCIQTPNC